MGRDQAGQAPQEIRGLTPTCFSYILVCMAERKKCSLTLYVAPRDASLLAQARAAAKRNRQSLSAFVVALLEERLATTRLKKGATRVA